MKLPPASAKASRRAKEDSLVMEPIAEAQASPMDMPPRQRGETRTPAVGERMRYRPSSVWGWAAGVKGSKSEGGILG